MIEFKNDKARDTYIQLDDRLKNAIYFCSKWCEERGLPFVITRAIDAMIEGVSVSRTHEEGRAVDVSIKGWASDEIDDFVHDSNKMFAKDIGAVSAKDGIARFCVFHVGTGPHFHLQIKRGV